MTDEERVLLVEAHEKTTQMYAAFMESRVPGEPAFIERVNLVVTTFERSSWAGKWLIRIFLGLAALVGAYATIKTGGGK